MKPVGFKYLNLCKYSLVTISTITLSIFTIEKPNDRLFVFCGAKVQLEFIHSAWKKLLSKSSISEWISTFEDGRTRIFDDKKHWVYPWAYFKWHASEKSMESLKELDTSRGSAH